MKTRDLNITSNSIRLFSVLLVSLVFFPMSIAQAVELNLVQKGYIQPTYAVNASLSSRSTSTGKATTLNWLLNNSVVDNGVYSLNLTQSKQGKTRGKYGSVWDNLDLNLNFELLPDSYIHTTFPRMSEPHFTKDELMTRFRVNRSRIMFTVGGSWY